MNGAEAEGTCSFDIIEDVVDEDGLRGRSFYGFEGGLENYRRRFAGADRAGVDAGWAGEELKKVEGGFQMSDVDGIGVGEQSKFVFF